MSNAEFGKKLIHCEEYIPVGGGGTKTLTKGRVQKKKLEFSNRGGRGSENKKKIPTFPKTVPFYLECHDSARNVIKNFWPYVPPYQFCCCPTLILMFMEEEEVRNSRF